MLLLLLACIVDPSQGTAVGNPTGLDVQTAPGTSIGFTSASAKVTSATQTACDGSVTTIAVNQQVDLLGGTRLTLGKSSFCALALQFGSPLSMTGTGSGHVASLNLTVPEVKVSSTEIKPGIFVLELGTPGWVDLLDSDLSKGDVTVTEGDPRHSALVAAILHQSSLFTDDDEDGKVEDREREHASAEAEDDSTTAQTDEHSGTTDSKDSGDTGKTTTGTDDSGGTDTSTDSGTDSGGTDSGTNTGGTDSGTDTGGTDSGTDTGSTDTGHP